MRSHCDPLCSQGVCGTRRQRPSLQAWRDAGSIVGCLIQSCAKGWIRAQDERLAQSVSEHPQQLTRREARLAHGRGRDDDAVEVLDVLEPSQGVDWGTGALDARVHRHPCSRGRMLDEDADGRVEHARLEVATGEWDEQAPRANLRPLPAAQAASEARRRTHDAPRRTALDWSFDTDP